MNVRVSPESTSESLSILFTESLPLYWPMIKSYGALKHEGGHVKIDYYKVVRELFEDASDTTYP